LLFAPKKSDGSGSRLLHGSEYGRVLQVKVFASVPKWNQHLEAHAALAAAAAGKEIVGKQENFVSSSVVCVYRLVDATDGSRLTWTISPLVSRH